MLRDTARFDELFALIFNDDPALALRAFLEVDEISRSRPDLIVPHRGALLDALERFDDPEMQRLAAVALTRVKLAPKERAKAAPVFERYLQSPSAATVLAALAALVDFAAEDGRYRRGVMPRIEQHMRDWTPALRTRAQRIVERLTPRTPPAK